MGKTRPKDIGTWGETQVLKKVVDYFPDARREVMHGDKDRGDITGCGQFIFEVKAGAQTKQFGDKKLAEWMIQAGVEAVHSGVRFGILITQRAGMGGPNAHRWWAHVHLKDLAEITGGHYVPSQLAVVRLELGILLDLLADHGYTPDVPATPILALEEDELVGSA